MGIHCAITVTHVLFLAMNVLDFMSVYLVITLQASWIAGLPRKLT